MRIDWSRFCAIVARHRVAGLVHEALVQCGVSSPAEHRYALAQDARRIALQGIQLAAETKRLCALAEAAGIPVIVLKGAPLAQIAYGMVTTKHAKDIDLAVVPGNLAAMREVLTIAGYSADGATACKDESWYHLHKKAQVELHAAFVDHPSWLQSLSIQTALDRRWRCTSSDIPTLAPDDLFAYLCVHGETHGWSRLKWLADLAALLAQRSPSEIEALHAYAATLGAERQAASALLLCASLLGTKLSEEHEAKLRKRRLIRWLAGNARRSFTGNSETAELDTMPMSTLRVHIGQFVTTMGWRNRHGLLMAKLGTQPRGGTLIGWPSRLVCWLMTRRTTAQKMRSGVHPLR
ncbi:nucleotidyltransferase domain-containing protein [Sphingomonas sp. M1A8_2b]